MMVEGYTCAMALDDYPSNMCANELFLPYCCQTCSMKKALIEAQVGQACTWPVSSKGRDLKSRQWKGYSRTSLAKCEEKAETEGVAYFAWTGRVYGGYCKVLKSSVSSPDLSTYQGYGYKLYEKQCPETVPECTPREMGGNTGRPAYKVQPVGTTTCPDNHFQVTSHIACDDFIEALCLKKGSAWEPDLRNAVCLLNGDRVEFYYLADLEQPQIVCVESSVSITLPPLGSESSIASSATYGNRLKKQSKPVCFPDGTKQNDEHCDLRYGSGCSVCKYGHYWWWVATYCCKQDTSRQCKCHSSEDEVAAAVSSMESSKLAIESSRTSMSNEVLESTGAKWFVLMFALVGAFAMMFAGAKVIYKRACASSEFRKILDAPEC